MNDLPSPVIVVPGITASHLQDEYELPPETVWTTLPHTRQAERVTLHPDGQRYEFVEPARVQPRGPFPLIYNDLIEELRDGLSDDSLGTVPVFPFGYDWRLGLVQTEQRLAEFVKEVMARTLLLKHYRDDKAFADQPKVSLIGHSMGGLIVSGYLQASKAKHVDKVVTIATPFQGSHEAIEKVVTGISSWDENSGKARERRMARMTPALYHLLPSFEGALSVAEGMKDDIFDSSAWQPNVLDTIKKQVKDCEISGEELFKQMLAEAKKHRDRISDLRFQRGTPESHSGSPKRDEGGDAVLSLVPEAWLAIAGVDVETRVQLEVQEDEHGPLFALRSSKSKRVNQWNQGGRLMARRNTGDGTVPLAGAIPPFLATDRLICVTPSDFARSELGDRLLSMRVGLHGALPRMNMLHRLILRFLLDKGDPYGNTWGWRVPGVSKWNPPLRLAEGKP